MLGAAADCVSACGATVSEAIVEVIGSCSVYDREMAAVDEVLRKIRRTAE